MVVMVVMGAMIVMIVMIVMTSRYHVPHEYHVIASRASSRYISNHFHTGKAMMLVSASRGMSFQVRRMDFAGFNSMDASVSAPISRFRVEGFEVS